MGSQRLIPLGYAMRGTMAGPHDGMELERRMCRWVMDMHADPRVIPGPWVHEGEMTSLPSAPEMNSGRAKSTTVEGAQ
jgi:hypothetical protein